MRSTFSRITSSRGVAYRREITPQQTVIIAKAAIARMERFHTPVANCSYPAYVTCEIGFWCRAAIATLMGVNNTKRLCRKFMFGTSDLWISILVHFSTFYHQASPVGAQKTRIKQDIIHCKSHATITYWKLHHYFVSWQASESILVKKATTHSSMTL